MEHKLNVLLINGSPNAKGCTYTALSEVGRTSMATEPGVLTLFSMQDKANPAKIYILEVYADSAAYQHHIQTPHFRKYKESTAAMVRSLKLIDVDPLVELRVKQ